MRPGRSTMRRMERAVTLLPQPLSPTMPSVRPGRTSKLAPSTALVMPSSAKKNVCRSRTLSSGSSVSNGSDAVWVGSITQAVAQEIEGQNDDDHRHGGHQQPGRDGQCLNVLRFL